MNEDLRKALTFFTRETGIMADLSVACGAGDRTETALDGETAGEDTVFDLASVTKLFTGLTLMSLKEDGLLDFSRPVCDYDPRFRNLGDVTVGQLAGFQVCVQTRGRIDESRSREEALQRLTDAAPGQPGPRAYSDIPAMILKYVIEKAAGMPLADCVRERILEKAGMTETWAKVPEERIPDCESYDREYRIEKGRRFVRTGMEKGIPHDPKAALLQGRSGDLCGHAGLFSTRGDLVKFCRAILERRIVGDASLEEMAVNRTGKRREDGSYTQFLGYQCYLRHPDQYYSEIPAYMGRRAFGIGGFTGNHLSVDPERQVFCIFLGNRVQGRLTVLIPEEGKKLTDYGLQEDGRGLLRWEDGTMVPSSVQYVHQKDEHLHRVVAEILGLREVPFEAHF